MSITRIAFAFLSLPSLALTLSAQSVIVVDDDGGPGVDHTSIADAAAAAAAGDTILVRSGVYGQVSIDRPMAIVADTGATVGVQGVLATFDTGGEIYLRGLSVGVSFGPTLFLANLTGPVWVQDCVLSGGIALGGVGGGPAFELLGCTDVIFVDCVAVGGSDDFGSPVAAGAVVGTNAYFMGCELSGRAGAPGQFFSPPQDGGAGLFVTGSTVHVEATTILGGDGGAALGGCVGGLAGAGGTGVEMGTGELQTHGATIAGGRGGTGVPGCTTGADGMDVDPGTSGTLVAHPGTARTLASEAVRREGESLTITTQGEPGDFTVIGISAEQDPRFVDPIVTPLLIAQSPFKPLRMGIAPASGTLSKTLPIPELGLDAALLYLQVGLFDTSLELLLGQARAVTLLDSAF